MLIANRSQNTIIITELRELKNAMPPMPPLPDIAKPQLEIEDTKGSVSFIEDIDESECGKSDITSIIQTIDDKIWRIKVYNKPIRCKQQEPENTPTEELTKVFRESSDTEKDCPPESWIRLGTWWLLKV